MLTSAFPSSQNGAARNEEGFAVKWERVATKNMPKKSKRMLEDLSILEFCQGTEGLMDRIIKYSSVKSSGKTTLFMASTVG